MDLALLDSVRASSEVLMTTIGLAIPSIPPRADLLARALRSVNNQWLKPDRLVVVVDHGREGAAATRNRAWRALGDVDYVAFLDDDDELDVDHLSSLLHEAELTNADMVFPWFTVIGADDPFPQDFGKQWPAHPQHQTTITCLWKRTALEMVGGFPGATSDYHDVAKKSSWAGIGEDRNAVQRLHDAGGKIVHLPQRTWFWHHDSGNTSGRPDRW